MRADGAQREITNLLRTKIIQWAGAGRLRPVVMYPPFSAAVGGLPGEQNSAQVISRHGPLLTVSRSHRFSLSNRQWPEIGLHSNRHICLGCIVEGEIDFSVGVTERMVASDTSLDGSHGQYVLALPLRDVFLIPPGVPYSDGSRPHWERPELEKVRSRILWIQILPMGAVLHTCITQGWKHQHTAAVIVKNTRLAFLAQLLMEHTRGLPRTGELLHSTLLTIFLTIEHELLRGTVLRVEPSGESLLELAEQGGVALAVPDDSDAEVLKRALNYIASCLSDPLTPAQIAANAYVSLPKLKRLFRDELQTSIMRYVMMRRIEEAKLLLEGTTLATQEVSRIAGYVHRTQFSRHFAQLVGVSPGEYRRQKKAASSSGSSGGAAPLKKRASRKRG